MTTRNVLTPPACIAALAGAASVGLATGDAAAQVFPADEDWVHVDCVGEPMWDPHRDQSGATGERDIVGDDAAPAGYRALDDEYLYLRMRVDSPATNDDGSARSFAWVFGFDLDRDATTYQLLITADGVGDRVLLYTKTETQTPNDPTEPADDPPVAEFPFETHGQGVEALGSEFGGDADYYLDVAIPWEELVPLGLEPDTTTRMWYATSSNANRMNGDFACHADSGIPDLDEVVSDPVRADGGEVEDGWDVGPRGGTAFEGGGGCAAAAGSSGTPLLPLLGIALAIATRRRYLGSTSRAATSTRL